MLRFLHRPIGNAGTHDNQQICPLYSFVGIGLSVVSKHTEVKRMLFGQHTDPHHGMDQRNIELLTEAPDNLLSVSENDASSCTYQWPFCIIQCLGDFSDLCYIHFGLRFIAADRDAFRIGKRLLKLLLLHIDGYIDQNRAFSSGGCNIKRFLEHPRNIVRILHKIAVLYKRLRCPSNVDFLENISSQQLT